MLTRMTKSSIIQLLPWDTETFQKKIGKVSFEQAVTYEEFNELLTLARLEKYELLYIFQSEEIDFLNRVELAEMSLVDQKVIFDKKLEPEKLRVNISPFISEYQNENVTPQLLNLAYESGRYSRFYIDKHFSRNDFQKLYSEWITRSVSKEIADEVLVYEKEAIIAGMLTYKITDNVATIGLVAVDPQIQGKKIGTELMTFMEYKLSKLAVYDINVATQMQNMRACCFYKKNNYSIKQITNIYHVWL